MVFICEDSDGILYVHRGETGGIEMAGNPNSPSYRRSLCYQSKESALREKDSNENRDDMGNYILNGEYVGI
jgi:hypothetical protein